MARMRRIVLVMCCAALSILSPARPASAQASRQQVILDLRAAIASAAARKDAEALRALFTDDFTHTHAVGRVDDKATRLRSLVGADDTIEKVAPSEIAIRFYGDDTAVAIGRTTIGPDRFRWTTVYVRRGGRWMAAASHASKVS